MLSGGEDGKKDWGKLKKEDRQLLPNERRVLLRRQTPGSKKVAARGKTSFLIKVKKYFCLLPLHRKTQDGRPTPGLRERRKPSRELDGTSSIKTPQLEGAEG